MLDNFPSKFFEIEVAAFVKAMMNKTSSSSSFHKLRQLTRSIQIGITRGRFSLTKQEREKERRSVEYLLISCHIAGFSAIVLCEQSVPKAFF